MDRFWSDYVQTSEELYQSRAIRFHDGNRALWLAALGAEDGQDILEVGCAGGLFCHRIKQYLPGTRVTGVDFDEGHISFARNKAEALNLDCAFITGDAMALPFQDASFDLCYSHTVFEHVPHGPFFSEQHRVLRPGGRIAVFSVRTRLGLKDNTGTFAPGEEEQALMRKAWAAAPQSEREQAVGAYEMDEHDYPRELERAGFCNVDVSLFTVMEYAPDNASVSQTQARAQIEARRAGALAPVEKALRRAPDALTDKEAARLRELISARFDRRLATLASGERVWDFSTVAVLAATGMKPAG